MVLGIIAKVVGPAVRGFVRVQSRNIYTLLRAQDRIVDYTYRRTGLYNRGVVRGIKHGLISGQIIGGFLNLGLGQDNNGQVPSKPKQTKTSKPYKARGRQSIRYSSRCPPRRKSDTKYRYTYFGGYE